MKVLFTPLFLLFSVALFAQQITVSEPLTLRSDIAYHILGNQENHVLLFREMTNKFEVQAYDEGMRAKWDKEIVLDRGRPEIVEVISGNGEFEVLYKHRRKGKQFLKMHRYDAAANLRDSATIKMLGSAFFKPTTEIKFSEDKRKALLIDFDRISKFNGTMIDLDSMKVMWEQAYNSDDFFPVRELTEMLVDNRGNAYIVFDKDNRKAARDEHRLEIHACGPNFIDVQKLEIPMNGNLIYDADFKIDNLNQKFICGGLYSEKSLARATGYFYLSAGLPTVTQLNLQFHSFTDEDVAVLLDKKVKKNDGVTQLEVQEVVLRKDGGILLITERVKHNERGGTNMGRMDRYGNLIVDYYYDNIFIASLHPNGTHHWDEVLHKRQFSQDDEASYSSYFLLKTPSNLRLVFNDEIRNENLVSEYVISPVGTTDRNSVFNTERQELKLRFRDAVQIANNEMIVPSERKNRIKLVRVTY